MTVAGVRSAVRFRVNGRALEADVPGGARLLDVLRVDLGLTGTKEGCGEGECGACSVLVDGAVVASCLVPVAQVDGCDVLTVEGLAGDGRLVPLQEAFRETGAVQCGICTPGMLMAARAWLERGAPATEDGIREALAGNLCRCTGYTKILEAVEQAAREWEPGQGSVPAVAAEGPWTVPSSPAGPYRPPRVLTPRSLADALDRLADDPALRPIAGGTDIMVELATGARAPDRPLLDISRLEELRGIGVRDGQLVVGALATYAELRASPEVGALVPVLAEMASAVGAAQVQARGTIGGNAITASPAGDALPVLLATDATMEVASTSGGRTIDAASFWTAYRQTALRSGELLVAVRVPIVPDRRVRFRKLGTRRAQAIAKVVLAVAWRPDGSAAPSGGPDGRAPAWRDVRVALGSVAPQPIRAPRTEAVLDGEAPSASVADRAAQVVREEISPIDDVRSTAAYRREVTGRMLRRIILEEAAS
jgi:xanthine dehydrogenase small subunit